MGAPYTSFIQQIGDSQDPVGTVQDCVPFYGHGQDPADPAWGAVFLTWACRFTSLQVPTVQF